MNFDADGLPVDSPQAREAELLLKCPRCGGTGQEPFDDHVDSSQNPHVKVTCDRCGGTGKR